MSQNKVYTPLALESRQIRLLVLLPSRLSISSIKCELTVASLDSVEDFEALSYVWGPSGPKDLKCIEVNNQKMLVTPNLYAALHALRMRRDKRLLWVDAVCINQNDIPERNSQVAQMRLIYEAAKDVAVWLGSESSGSSTALAFVKTLASQFAAAGSSQDTFKRWLVDKCVGCSPDQERVWGHLAVLLSRPYWTRSWIYQELIVPTSITVYCGKVCVPWRDFETLAFAIDTHETSLAMLEPITNNIRVVGVYHGLYNVALARSQRAELGFMGTPTLLEALCTQRSRNATDPKDKVFSLLGVTINQRIGRGELPSGPNVAIDYSRSLSEVYKGVARHIIETTRSYNVLCACQNPDRDNGIPSWAPDWSTKRTNGPLMNPDQWGHIYFASGVMGFTSFPDPPDSDTLVVYGVHVNTISKIGAVHEYGCDWQDLKSNWSQLALTCAWQFSNMTTVDENGDEAQAEPCYITTESIAQAFFNTITCGRIDHDVNDDPEDIIKMEMARIEAIEQRRFFVTHSGYMGLGPAQARVGDKIVVVDGVNVPLVLREEPSIDRHAVVGEAFVHGLMNGEAADEEMHDALQKNLGRSLRRERLLLR